MMVATIPEGYRLVDRYKWVNPDDHAQGHQMNRRNQRVEFVERFVEHIETGDLYFWEEKNSDGSHKWYNIPAVVRVKCFAISYGMLMYLPFKILNDTGTLIRSVGINVWHGRVVEVLKDIGCYVVDRICDPYFAGCIMLIAVFGIFFPYEARAEIGKFERVWHHVDVATVAPSRYAPMWCMWVCSPFTRTSPFYIAGCFQVRGNRAERKYHLVEVVGDVPLLPGMFYPCC